MIYVRITCQKKRNCLKWKQQINFEEIHFSMHFPRPKHEHVCFTWWPFKIPTHPCCKSNFKWWHWILNAHKNLIQQSSFLRLDSADTLTFFLIQIWRTKNTVCVFANPQLHFSHFVSMDWSHHTQTCMFASNKKMTNHKTIPFESCV